MCSILPKSHTRMPQMGLPRCPPPAQMHPILVPDMQPLISHQPLPPNMETHPPQQSFHSSPTTLQNDQSCNQVQCSIYSTPPHTSYLPPASHLVPHWSQCILHNS